MCFFLVVGYSNMMLQEVFLFQGTPAAEFFHHSHQGCTWGPSLGLIECFQRQGCVMQRSFPVAEQRERYFALCQFHAPTGHPTLDQA